MSRSILFAIVGLLASASVASAQNDIIISQYVDTNSGTAPKGIELWNISGGTLDFSVTPLVVLKGTNGGALNADATVNSGTLGAGEVMVIGTADMGTYLTDRGLGSVLFVSESFTFNGDDALQITLGGNVEDTFGTPGSDPGSAWSGNGVSTADQNIALLSSVTAGDTDGFTDPSERFEVASADPASGCGLVGFGLAPGGDTAVCQGVFDGAGWRLLSVPVSGLTVGDLAGINLVQGVAAGTTNPAQYETAGDNLFTEYTGGNTAGSYNAPADTDEILAPGRGFWWYWFDADAGPFAGGTSQGFELSSFVLAASGPTETTDVTEAFTNNADDFYMAGNPFASDFTLTGVSSSVGTLATSFFVYDPSAASGAGAYVPLTDSDALAPWQGAFAQVTGEAGADPTFTYAAASAGGSGATFYGRTAAAEQIDLRLDGTLASGASVGDRSARIRFLGDAETGWDRHDLSELAPPSSQAALLALVGERDGEAERQAVLSLPTSLAGTQTVPVAFLTSGDGSFVISWDAAVLPAGWAATLRDTETGTEADLAAEGTLAFDADQTDWVDRFEILLASSAVSTEDGADAEAFVGDVFPNPAAGPAGLSLRLGEAQRVTATVYDAIGRQVAVAFEGDLGVGTQRLALDAETLAPGVYVVRVAGETFTEARRLVVTR